MTAPNEPAALLETASSTLALLQQCAATLMRKNQPEASRIKDAPDPLDVLHDAAKLLKAHTTKLSLLVINKPFTPSAIRKIISEITGGCIPAMMSAVEICRPARYGRTLHEESKFRVRRVLKEYEGMMGEVIERAKELSHESAAEAQKENKREPRDTLASTGVVWEACDSLMELKAQGTVGVVVKKAHDYKAMLEDAIEELKDWGEGEDEGFSEPEVEDEEGTVNLEKAFGSTGKMPVERTDLKELLSNALKKLKLINTLFTAIVKRRLKTMEDSPPSHRVPGCAVQPMVAGRVDGVLNTLAKIPDDTDELANAFYELDRDEAINQLETVCQHAKDAVDLVRINWSSKEDEFSAWSQKWLAAIG